MVDAVGGVDVNVTQALDDPRYKDFGVKDGWSVDVGKHHFDGIDALAYARVRKSVGQTDFTRQARQQEILLALRQKVVRGRGAAGPAGAHRRGRRHARPPTCRPSSCPTWRSWPARSRRRRIVRVVIRCPLIHPGKPNNPYGAVQVANMDALSRDGPGALPARRAATPTGWTPKDGKPSLAPGELRPERQPGQLSSRGRPERTAIRRAAFARCEIRFFSAADHSPSVRPPGGSPGGSKIGS